MDSVTVCSEKKLKVKLKKRPLEHFKMSWQDKMGSDYSEHISAGHKEKSASFNI